MRTLASIQKIEWKRPIEGRDRIELCGVLGWQLITKKDEFHVGDLCVFIEPDAVLPDKPEFDFLRSKGFRIKTMKMAGCLSQGICFPLSILPDGTKTDIGTDVTEALGITQFGETMDTDPIVADKKTKYPKFLMRMSWFRKLVLPKSQSRAFPGFISKTDETRIQSMPWVLTDKRRYIATEKVDGCVVGEGRVKTDVGDIQIKDIVNKKMKVNVLSYNDQTHQCEYKPVTDWHKIPANRQRYKIAVGYRGKGNRPKFIECTDNHKFLTGRGWVRADELTTDDILMHYSPVYPSELDEIVVGCLLGDSSLNANSASGGYRTVMFNHSVKQSEYFLFKQRLLGSWFMREQNAVSGYGSELLRGKLISNLKTWTLLDSLFPNGGKKVVTEQFADMVTPISLAFWFMDDGTLKNRDDDHLGCRAMLCTNGFSFDECSVLKNMLKRKYSIDVSIGDKDIYKGYVLIFDVENTNKLCTLIAPYICDSMKYKLPKKYAGMPCVLDGFTLDYAEGCVTTSILSIEKIDMSETKHIRYVYDLEVADNHNYFYKNILVHNCSGTFALVRRKSKIPFFGDKFEYIVCSRNCRLWNKDNSSYWRVSEKYNIEKTLRAMIGSYEWIAIQGECIASNVQGNKYHVTEPDLFVFNLIYPTGRLDSMTAKGICEKNGLQFVPIVDTDYVMPDTVEEVLEYAHGESKLYPTLREGIVFRSYDGKYSFKAVDPLFLIKYDE